MARRMRKASSPRDSLQKVLARIGGTKIAAEALLMYSSVSVDVPEAPAKMCLDRRSTEM
jgi:hypothetical protein